MILLGFRQCIVIAQAAGSPFKKERECVLRVYPKLVKIPFGGFAKSYTTVRYDKHRCTVSVDSIQIATQKRAMIGNNYAPSGQLIINSNFNLPLACFGYVPDFPFCTQVQGLCLGY